jgi:hypothetical protein
MNKNTQELFISRELIVIQKCHPSGIPYHPKLDLEDFQKNDTVSLRNPRRKYLGNENFIGNGYL